MYISQFVCCDMNVLIRIMLSRSLELYRQGGISELSRGIRDYIKHDFGPDYQDRRTDNRARWEFISSHIDHKNESLIDIGCAEGAFAAKAAELGLEVTAFDRNVTRLQTAKIKHANYDNLRFVREELTPESIDELPESDVILFLTVHHHWVESYGWQNSIKMFRKLLQKADKLFYEPPGNIGIKESVNNDFISSEDSVNYYTNILNNSFGDDIEILDVMITEYDSNSHRNDPLFAIDCSNL